MRCSWLGLALLSGCTFTVAGLSVDGGGDGGVRDLAVISDLSGLGIDPVGVANPDDYNQVGLVAVTLAADTTFDSDTGAISGGLIRSDGSGVINGVWFRAVDQVGGPRVGVFGFASLTSAAKIFIKGNNAVAFVSAGDVTLAGLIDVRGFCNKGSAGPGGSTGGVSNGDGNGSGKGKGGNTQTNSTSGGGGAGHCDTGGAGAGGPGVAGGAGGPAYDDIVLLGGSGGGSGGGNTGTNSVGGGGGGALQLVANGSLTLAFGGGVNAGGCGGEKGASGRGGSGGGSGGLVLLEAVTITLAPGSAIAVNGGGGGGGDNGTDGQAGLLSAVSAPAGSGNNQGVAGGLGGAKAHLNGYTPADATGGLRHGGGGGGSTGRIIVHTSTGSFMNQGSVLSPAPGETSASGKPAFISGMSTFQ